MGSLRRKKQKYLDKTNEGSTGANDRGSNNIEPLIYFA